ncbi:hypothetical protein DFH07DRAFT_1061439 [Mycena maculata]|uniref:Chromo domain-containing protein n=1 Tax=Mycena maculata TaxID=230809 RepID=A0AAD7NC80_9AGAR|nr:hypothetical protein DFH07DRAFT_1061439 [Mycena maculata]
MSELDWSKTDVTLHPDSPWLTIPPTEKAMQEFCPDVVFCRSEVRNEEKFAAEVAKLTLFGHPKMVEPIKPLPGEFLYPTDQLSPAPPPSQSILVPPPLQPDDPRPPRNFVHPEAGIFTLRKTQQYQRGYVYTTPYYLQNKERDHARMLRVVAPPQLYPKVEDGKYIHLAVPQCVQMVPGVPFAFEIEGQPDRLHTIGAVHTFESLRHEPEFWDILKDTILVAKGLNGCRPVGNNDPVFPISTFVLKPNDRSPVNVPSGSKAGSYNLASTVIKGIGPGVFAPAAQVDTPDFAGQINDHHGSHRTSGLPRQRKTYLLLLLCLPPGSDAGAFLLARAGIYIRELNTWAIHLFFDGTDIHVGAGATTTQSVPEFKEWVESELEMAWNASVLGRLGIVQYANRSAHLRDAYMSMTPPVRFGNFAPDQHHLSRQRDFATHGQEILGGQRSWANLMGREAIYAFWNTLQLCNLDLDTDLDDLIQSIKYKDSSGNSVPLESLPLHPIRDAKRIARSRGHFEYLRQQCAGIRIYIEKHYFLEFRERLRTEDYVAEHNPDQIEPFTVNWNLRSSIPTRSDHSDPVPDTRFNGTIIQILDYLRVEGMGCYKVLTDESEAAPILLAETDPRLPKPLINDFVNAAAKRSMLSSILDKPDSPLPEIESTSTSGGAPVTTNTSETNTAVDMSTDSPAGGTHQEETSNGTSPILGNDSIPTEESLTPEPDHPSGHTRSKQKERDSEKSKAVDEEEFEIDQIYDVRQDCTGKWYKVHFVIDNSVSWVHENDLDLHGCKKLLAQFYKDQAEHDSDQDASDDSDDPESATSPGKRKRRLKKKESSTEGKASKRFKPAPVTLDETRSLEALLNVQRLTREADEVKQRRPTFGPASTSFFNAITSGTFAPSILETCFLQDAGLSTLEMVIGRSSTFII